MKRQNRQFTKFISLLKFPGLQYFLHSFDSLVWSTLSTFYRKLHYIKLFFSNFACHCSSYQRSTTAVVSSVSSTVAWLSTIPCTCRLTVTMTIPPSMACFSLVKCSSPLDRYLFTQWAWLSSTKSPAPKWCISIWGCFTSVRRSALLWALSLDRFFCRCMLILMKIVRPTRWIRALSGDGGQAIFYAESRESWLACLFWHFRGFFPGQNGSFKKNERSSTGPERAQKLPSGLKASIAKRRQTDQSHSRRRYTDLFKKARPCSACQPVWCWVAWWSSTVLEQRLSRLQ